MRIVVGLSGGVDSSVAAWLLQQAGHEVIGIFMRNWHDESVIIDNECPWIDDANDAMLVASHLGIPFQVLDLSAQYKERIVDYMFEEYAAGRTPNPDVLCNREVKFDLFLESALELGAEGVATGHYCRKETLEVDGQVTHRLLAGVDTNKDQSYFLCQLTQAQLEKAHFPIGELTKPEVRRLAEEIDLPTANKKDSQGLCFIGKVRLPDFLQQQLEPKTGDIIEIRRCACASCRCRENRCFSAGALGSRRWSLCRATQRRPLFYQPAQRDSGRRQTRTPVRPREGCGAQLALVGQGENHPGLLRHALRIHADEAHWIRPDRELAIGESMETLQVRIRYRQPLQAATITRHETHYEIAFAQPQSGVAAGQFAAWYDGDECIGSGVIAS